MNNINDTLFVPPSHIGSTLSSDKNQSISVMQEETIGQIVAKDLYKADVFKKYGIDFCCGGKRTLKDACKRKGIDFELVKTELEIARPAGSANDYNQWGLDFMVDFIFNQHHLYYYRVIPEIKELMNKVVARHAIDMPDVFKLNELSLILIRELSIHFAKEEGVVFPLIKALVAFQKSKNSEELNLPGVSASIQMMESEHEEAGEILAEMKRVTNDYTPHTEACNTFRVLYNKLKELDEDLQLHIHLENNILFPAAVKLEKEQRLACMQSAAVSEPSSCMKK